MLLGVRSLRFHFRHPTVLPLRAGPADDKSNEKLRRASPESYHPVARVDDTLATLRIETAGMRPCSSVTLYAAAPGRKIRTPRNLGIEIVADGHA